jgi:hypothetical protein
MLRVAAPLSGNDIPEPAREATVDQQERGEQLRASFAGMRSLQETLWEEAREARGRAQKTQERAGHLRAEARRIQRRCGPRRL